MKEEVKKVLKMVEEGKIDSEKASALIEALNQKDDPVLIEGATSPAVDYGNRMLKINVISHDGDNVNVKLPVKVIKAVGGAINKIPGADIEGVDIKAIIDAIDCGLDGKIVDVHSAQGDIVEIVIE